MSLLNGVFDLFATIVSFRKEIIIEVLPINVFHIVDNLRGSRINIFAYVHETLS